MRLRAHWVAAALLASLLAVCALGAAALETQDAVTAAASATAQSDAAPEEQVAAGSPAEPGAVPAPEGEPEQAAPEGEEGAASGSAQRHRVRQTRSRLNQGDCTSQVQQYIKEHTADLGVPQDINKLIFFLHVPRTAGKTYANCFIRTALPPSKRCAKSYDTVRLNVSVDSCVALISHDDYSISQWFPEGAATITQLRRPVDRVLSAYEFAVDIAAKGVMHQEVKRNPNRKRKADFVGTLEVWPWSHLIPWFKRDMRQRMAKLREQTRNDPTAWRDYKSPDNRTYWWNEAKNSSVWTLPDPDPVLDPYNNSLAMPLHEWIEHPIAEELIHNGATLQVLGLTNYSYWQGHKELRACMRSSAISREMLLSLASKRLQSMAHVGLTEQLELSVLSMAADLGIKLDSPAYKYTSASAFTYDMDAVDLEDPISFNATSEGGVNMTVARGEALARMKTIAEEMERLRPILQELTPKLNELVEREAEWLEEQDKLKEAAGKNSAGNSTESAAEKQGSSAGADGNGAGERADAAAESGSKEAAAEGSKQSEQAADGGKQSEEGAAGEKEAAAEEGKEQEAAGDGKPKEKKTKGKKDKEAEKIESPWAEEIEVLDDKVAAMQERMRHLEAELTSLTHSDLITIADDAKGKARQLLPDEHFLLHNETLGQAYLRCANAGKTRTDKRKPYKHLRTPWAETFAFRSDARRKISRATLDRIHQLNLLDEELWKIGDQLLRRKLDEQHKAGLLESFPPPPPHRPRPSPTKKRELQSEKERKKLEEERKRWSREGVSGRRPPPSKARRPPPPSPPLPKDDPRAAEAAAQADSATEAVHEEL